MNSQIETSKTDIIEDTQQKITSLEVFLELRSKVGDFGNYIIDNFFFKLQEPIDMTFAEDLVLSKGGEIEVTQAFKDFVKSDPEMVKFIQTKTIKVDEALIQSNKLSEVTFNSKKFSRSEFGQILCTAYREFNIKNY